MKVNDIINNFKLLEIKQIKDIDSTMYVFLHQKSKATLVYLENDDNNKCFAYGFKTIPENSTGIAHIIEHSLLCGSKKYPLKEPFVNLIKGSMATFLNAFTADDFTMYPVASLNDDDFDNLVSVYMDACLAPLSIIDNKPFLQEGWHYELNDLNDPLAIKGVVYNEMKGATSTVNSQLMYFANEQIYKGSNYEYNSGGDPEVIPTLTYKYYQDFYKRHYHPSNGLIYLYGKMDIVKKLKFFDEEYLSKYDDNVEKITIKEIKPIINLDACKYYPIDKNDSEKDNTYFALSFALCKYENALELKAMQIINEVLMESNDSFLKKTLLEANLGQDVSSYINDGSILPTFNILLKKSNIDKKEKFYETFINTCKKIVKDGLDKKALLATINNAEFKNKEMDSGNDPKGLYMAFSLMQCFNYNVPFEDYLEYQKYFDFYKKEINNGYFEKLIEKYFLNSSHYTLVTLLPSKTLQEENENTLKEKLENIKKSMSNEQLCSLIKENKRLNKYQSHIDTKEELACLPSLKLNQIHYSVPSIPTKKVKIENRKYLYHNLPTNGIGYLKMYFDASTISLQDLPYIKILSALLIELDTKNFTSTNLISYIKTYLGDLYFSNSFYSNDKNKCDAKFIISCSALKENINYISQIINEIIDNTIFDIKRVKTILLQLENGIKNSLMSSSGAVINETRAACSKLGSISSIQSGYNYYCFIKKLNSSENFEEIIAKLKNVLKTLFNKNNLIISISGDESIIKLLEDEVNKLHLNTTVNKKILNAKITNKENKALIIPSQINFDAMGTNIEDYGYKVNGHFAVLNHILRYDYLWNKIRVKGGAYGANISLYNNNDLILSSYRDPNVKNTYNSFENIYKYIENLQLDDDDLKTYIIGCVGNYDPVGSTNYLINDADLCYLNKISNKLRRQKKKEILTTTLDDLHAYKDLFKKIAKDSARFTIGNETKINEYDKFSKKITL